MPKYLIAATYTAEGAKGLMKEGGSSRRNAIEKLIQARHGHLESMYWAFGDDDVFLIVDLPGPVDAAAIGLTVGASGAVRTSTRVLLTAEEIDQASHETIDYRPPGA